MAIAIAIVMHHASDGIICHVLIVIIEIQDPTATGLIPPEYFCEWLSGCVRLGSIVRVPLCIGISRDFHGVFLGIKIPVAEPGIKLGTFVATAGCSATD